MSHVSKTMSTEKEIINEARKELLIRKNPLNSIKILMELDRDKTFDDKLLKYTLALAYLENKNYSDAAKIYYDLNEKYQAGFCELLQGKIDVAKDLWSNIPNSEATSWGKSLIELLNLKFNSLPTFIQIRNHLECDIGYFIQAERLDFVENMVKSADILSSVNPETYKFIGKALFNNGFANLSIKYFLKGQKIVPQDAEIYYHLGQYSYLVGAFQEGKQILDQCLALNKYYVPARGLLEKIEAKINKDSEKKQ
jgi:tetratricopeptide (TPR) repeat protein